MNNEEKILAMLTEMRSDITGLKTAQAEIQATQAEQGKALAAVQATQAEQGKALAAVQATQAEQGKALAAVQATQAEMQAVLAEHRAMLQTLDDRSLKSAVLLETDIPHKLHLLYEGHSTIMEVLGDLAPKDRMEVLEDEVITLKTVVKSMSKRLAALEKVQ